jgi:hypothetical protein
MYSTVLERAAFICLLSAVAVLAADPPTPTAEQHPDAAKTFIDQQLSLWQKRLRLDDWHLTASLVPATDLKARTLGNIHWDSSTKIADIKVLRAEDYKMPYPQALRDMEFTVVHELVHLRLSTLPRSEASRGAEEHAVNELTQSLLDLAAHKQLELAAQSAPKQ